MTIDKAIELIGEYVNREDFYQVEPETQAMMLGIEALKQVKFMRVDTHIGTLYQLPGETKD